MWPLLVDDEEKDKLAIISYNKAQYPLKKTNSSLTWALSVILRVDFKIVSASLFS